jgi:plasmid stability protein
MPVTLTIKQVPDALAAQLKERAASQRRSLQKELLSIMEQAVDYGNASAMTLHPRVAEPAQTVCAVQADRRSGRKAASGRLTLEQLWQRARKLGAGMNGESAAIIRRDRDARHGG